MFRDAFPPLHTEARCARGYPTRQPSRAASATTAATLLAGAGLAGIALYAVATADLSPLAAAGFVAAVPVELACSAYAVALLISAAVRLLVPGCADVPALKSSPSARPPCVGIVYLCADDADWPVLEGIAQVRYDGPLHVVIADDSVSASNRVAVDGMAGRLRGLRSWRVDVLRRPEGFGGRAAALNGALAQADRHFAYVLVCDHDSMLAPDTLERALPYMQDPRLAGVQLGTTDSESRRTRFSRHLADVPAAFHLSLPRAAHVGWTFLTGANALLSTAAVKEVGGVLPGWPCHGIDLTVRLNLAGFRIAFAPGSPVATKEPSAREVEQARRLRASGSVRLLRAYWRPIMRSRLPLTEKLAFLQVAAYDSVQAGLLAGFPLAIALAAGAPAGAWHALVAMLTAPLAAAALVEGHWLSRSCDVLRAWRTPLVPPLGAVTEAVAAGGRPDAARADATTAPRR